MWEFMWEEPKHRTKHKTFRHFYESRTLKKINEVIMDAFNHGHSMFRRFSPVNQMTRASLCTEIYQLILIKFVTCIYRISKRISFKPFFPTCFRYQIHSGIEHGHDLGTTKNRWITNQEILGLSIFIFFLNIGLMIGFKAKARASAYFFLYWGGDVGVFLWVGCVWGGGYICLYGWGVLELGRREKRNHTIISYLLH